MGFRFIKNKKEEEELINRGKQLSEQYARNRQQAQQQAQEQLKDYKFVKNPNSWNERLRVTRHNYGENSQEFQNQLGRYYQEKFGTTTPTIQDRMKSFLGNTSRNYLEAWTHPINFIQRSFGNYEAQERFDRRNESTWNKIQQQTEQFNNIANEWKQSGTVGEAYDNTKRLLNVGLGIAKNYAGAENNTGIPLSQNTIDLLNKQKPIFDEQGMVANYRDKNINLPQQINTSQNIQLPTKDLQEKRLEENKKDSVAQELIKKADINKSEEQLEGTDIRSLARANELSEMMDNGQTASALLQRFQEDVTGAGGRTIKGAVSVVPMVAEGIARLTGDEQAVQDLIDLRNDINRDRFNTAEIRSNLKSVREAQGKGGIGNDLLYMGSNVVDNMTGQLTAGALAGGSFITNPANNYTTAIMSVGAMGNAFNEREQKQGYSNKAYAQNLVASTLEGIWNGVLEEATGGTFATERTVTDSAGKTVVRNEGWLDKLLFNKLAKKGIVNTNNMALVNGIWKYAGEVVEEVGTDLFTAVTNQIAGEKFSDNFNLSKEKDTITYTLITTMIMNALGMGGLNTEEFAKQYDITEADVKKLQDITNAVLSDNGLSQEEAKTKVTEKLKEHGIDVNNIDKTIENVNESENYKTALSTISNKINLSEDTKQIIRDIATTDGIITKSDYDNVINKINTLVQQDVENQQAQIMQNASVDYDNLEAQKNALDELTPEKFNNQESRQFYAQQMNKPLTYNVDTILDAYPENRNGKRTVRQWKDMSKQIGTQMAIDGLSIDEVRANAVGLWQQLEPSKNITRYDNQEHKNKGFDKLNNEIWTKGIYDSYKETMKTQLEQQQEQATSEEVLNPQLEAIDDNTNILLDTIDSFNANEQVSQQVKESLLESAERYGFKGKTLNEVQALMEKRGISSRFDDTKFNDSRVGSFYDPDNNEIVFNPNASEEQIIQELAVHEWYHELKQNNTEEATKIQEDIINYLKRNNQYADIRKNLEKTYIEQGYDKNRPDFTDMIDEEATAKALQQVLGNEEEIQRLNNYNRNLARRIYDAVVNLLNKFTGGRNEKLFWTNVRNNFERVFNTPGTANENNQSNNQKRLSTDTESQEQGSINLQKINEKYKDDVDVLNLTENGDTINLGNIVVKKELRKQGIGQQILNDIIDYANETGKTITLTPTSEFNTKERLKKWYKANGFVENKGKNTNFEISDTMYKTPDNNVKYSVSTDNTNNRFDVTGNENLAESGTVFFRTRPDGDYYVQATNNAGDLIYEGTFIGKKDMAKTLGEDLANYIINNSEENSNELYIENKGNKPKDYKMWHRPSQEYGDGSNFEANMSGVFEHPEWYMDMSKAYNKESLEALRKVRNNPDAEITVYRATPGNDINPGDWITPSKKYAEFHNESQLDGKGNIVEKKIKVNEMLWGGDDINEFGYYPEKNTKLSTSNQPTTDNQGRELSKGQQEFFKDSQARDENGNLIEMYHGTNENFTVFDKNGKGKRFTNFGTEYDTDVKGFFFTSNKSYAEEFGNVKPYYLNTKKILKLDNNIDDLNKIFQPMLEDMLNNQDITKTQYDAIIENGTTYKRFIDEDGIDWDIIDEEAFNDSIKIMKELGYDSIAVNEGNDNTSIMVFNSNQIKNIDNTNPTENPDIRYSKNTQDYDSWIKENLPKLGNKKTKLSDLKVPTKKQANVPVQKLSADTTPEILPEEKGTFKANQKQRKAYKSIIESEFTSKEAKQIAYDYLNSDTYVPDSNKEQLDRADKRIERNGIENELASLETNVNEGKKITADDIAVGDRLIKYYMTTGDKANLERSIRAMAMAGTQAGRTVQAFAMIRHQSPEGMAIWIQNSVDKLNSNLKGKQQFEFTPEMQEKILNSNSENLQQNVDEVMKELGQQVPVDFLGKLDAWRYFSMLGNPKTHIRNIVGNFAMAQTQKVKSKIAGTIEQVTGQDRTHTSLFERRNRKAIEFAKQDFKNADVKALLGIGTSKYTNPKNMIQQNQRTFKSDLLEKTLGRLFNINDKLLEAEDNFGLKNAYIRNLSDYMTANKLTAENMTGEQLQQARKMAVEESLRATFHQASALATTLNQIEQKNLFSRVAMGGLVPFKKTPINVAKTGFTYSPVGLAKTILSDTVKLRQGKINVNEYIDNLSQGLTGTGIALLGYGLAEAGILKAGGDDDKEDKYKQAMGNQQYAINNIPVKELLKKMGVNVDNIKDESYSLDWLAPAGIPLFVGAELNKLVKDRAKQGEDEADVINELERVSRLFDASATLLNPMSEMSMISGLTSTLQTFATDPGQGLMNLGINPIKSYVGQMAPTSLGQVARSTDEYERDTSSTAKGMIAKAVDSTKNQVMNKIPGLRQKLPTKKDIWGEEVKTQDYFHNAVLPYTKKEVKTNAVDKELNNLYEKTGENIYPTTSLDKSFTINGTQKRLTNEEYNKYKESYGKNSYRILNNLVNSNDYKKMTDEQKVKAIQDVYTYTKDLNKVDYAEKKRLTLETPSDVATVKSIKSYGGSETDYFKYKGLTKGLDKEKDKMEKIRNSDMSLTSKQAVYKSTIGKDDEFYNTIDSTNINEYLDYKHTEFESDKDENGKTVKNSLKNKKANYINSNISGYENRLLLMAKDYKLSRAEQQTLLNYINTQSNAEEIFNKLDKNFEVKNGRVYYK